MWDTPASQPLFQITPRAGFLTPTSPWLPTLFQSPDWCLFHSFLALWGCMEHMRHTKLRFFSVRSVRHALRDVSPKTNVVFWSGAAWCLLTGLTMDVGEAGVALTRVAVEAIHTCTVNAWITSTLVDICEEQEQRHGTSVAKKVLQEYTALGKCVCKNFKKFK